MRVTKARIEHFQSIENSGEISLDEHLTTLVGGNESGKSAILKALYWFNRDQNIQRDDISSLTRIRDQLDSGAVRASDVSVVTLWLILEEQDRPPTIPLGRFPIGVEVVVTKTLSNDYRVVWPNQPRSRRTADTGPSRLLELLKALRERLEKVYKGRVKRKLAHDSFVWLERYEGEPNRLNLVLFPEWAPTIWDVLEAGNWVQVTRFAKDPYGRNTRALNAGIAIDTEKFEATLEAQIKRLEAGKAVDKEFWRILRQLLERIPPAHPLAEILNLETLNSFQKLAAARVPARPEQPALDDVMLLQMLPQFVYISEFPDVSASIHLSRQARGEPERLLDALLKVAGLNRQVVATLPPYEQTRVLREKSDALETRLREYWIDPDLSCDLRVQQGNRLYLYIDSQRSMEPPVRRSKGLSYYLAVYARLSELAGQRNIVVLLDDPGQHMHPKAQRTLLRFLNSQPYQIVAATHSPFMIDPERLEQVRVVVRSKHGTQVANVWRDLDDILEPVWGRIAVEARGRDFLMVEGMNDVRAFSRLSEACRDSGLAHLPPEMTVFPGNGRQLPHLCRILHERGFRLVVVTDGDSVGKALLNEVRALANVQAATLDIIVGGASGLTLEGLFADRNEFDKATNPLRDPDASYAPDTLSRFEQIFKWIRGAWGSPSG